MSNERQPTVEELQARIKELESKLQNLNKEETEVTQFKEDINKVIDGAVEERLPFREVLELIEEYVWDRGRTYAHTRRNHLRGLRSYTRDGDRAVEDIRENAGYDRDRYSRRGGGDRRG